MFERYTDRSRKVLMLSNQHALRLNSAVIDTPHLLLGLLEEGSGVGCFALKSLGVDVAAARKAAEEDAGGVLPPKLSLGKLPLSPVVNRVVEHAIGVARGLGHDYVGTEHLTIALVEVDGSAGERVLGAQGVMGGKLRDEVVKLIGRGPVVAEEVGVAGIGSQSALPVKLVVGWLLVLALIVLSLATCTLGKWP
jgi:ATP-dependent Clp protease ATP-binding subunit ClpC